jgi:hypothetical protein
MELLAQFGTKDQQELAKLRSTNSEAATHWLGPGGIAPPRTTWAKEVAVAPGGKGDGGVRAQPSVVCHNPEQAERDAAVRPDLEGHRHMRA